jgi:hypothetical protein
MQLARPMFARDPRRFGRGVARELDAERTTSGELKLFALTFIAGFVFVSVLIG